MSSWTLGPSKMDLFLLVTRWERGIYQGKRPQKVDIQIDQHPLRLKQSLEEVTFGHSQRHLDLVKDIRRVSWSSEIWEEPEITWRNYRELHVSWISEIVNFGCRPAQSGSQMSSQLMTRLRTCSNGCLEAGAKSPRTVHQRFGLDPWSQAMSNIMSWQ